MHTVASSLLAPGEYWVQWVPRSPAESTPYLLIVLMAVLTMYYWSSSNSSLRAVPLINKSSNAFSDMEAKSSRSLMEHARNAYPGQPYRLTTDLGEVIVLPPDLANELRNEAKLSLHESMKAVSGLSRTPSWVRAVWGDGAKLLGSNCRAEAVDQEPMYEVTDDDSTLTLATAKITGALSEEAKIAFSTNFGDSIEWQQMTAKSRLLDIIARMSTRVFINEQLCRDDDWLRVTKSYTANVFDAAMELRIYPRVLRPLVNVFLPQSRKLRAMHAEASRMIIPVLKARREERKAALAAGDPVPEYNDALDWFDQEAQAQGMEFSAENLQLMLSVAAIHTTTDLFCQVVLDLAEHPEIFQPLREEIISQLQNGGWQKSSLYNMKLLDSVIKESQRRRPVLITGLRRMVLDDFQLSTGLQLKKGMRVTVDGHRMWDPTLHEDPLRWDGYRFLRMREQADRANFSQFITTSPDHLAFGHGEHACPGRFFAGHEIKVAMSHMLMKYEWTLVPGTSTVPLSHGFSTRANPGAQISIRRRDKVELDLDSL